MDIKILFEVTQSVTSFLLRNIILEETRMIKINGTLENVDGKTITEYLKTTNYNPKHIAIEINGKIVPKSTYHETILKDGDKVEIVSFVGGG